MKLTYSCLQCGTIKKLSKNVKGKFCSNICQGLYKWLNETKPRIEAGNCKEPVTLRKYLIEVRGDVCSICSTGSEWQDKPLTLHVDHIDGNSDNNNVDNLRLLCPNCHSQTDTFGCKGQGNRYKKITKRALYNRQYRSGRMV